MENNSGKKTIGKPWTPKEVQRSTTIPPFWNDGKVMRNTEILSCRSIGQKFIDLTTIDISHEAPYHQRNRYENTITMQSNDPNLQSGPMKNREMIQGSYESADVTTGRTRTNKHFYPEEGTDQATQHA